MILCFSATGNSRYCAETLAMATGDEVVSINDCLRNGLRFFEFSQEERLGLICPIYGWDIPWVVHNFLQECRFQNVTEQCYAYAVFTCGKSCGYAPETVRSLLAKKDIALKAAFAVCMPDTYVPMFPLAPEAEQRKMLCEAEHTLSDVCEAAVQKDEKMLLTKRPPKAMYRLIHSRFVPEQKKVAPFWTTDACTGCGFCEKICPQGIIQIQEGRPAWTEDRCAGCLACLHRCPSKALQYGKKTEKTGRYVNPNVRL